MFAKFRVLFCLGLFISNDEALETLHEMCNIAFYTSGMRAVRVVLSANSNTLRPSFALHTSDVGASKIGNKNLVENPLGSYDDDLPGKELLAIPFN